MVEGINPINAHKLYHAISLKEIKKIQPKELENLPDLNELYPDEELESSNKNDKEAKIARIRALAELEQKRLENLYFAADMIAKKYRNTDDPIVIKRLENDWFHLTEKCADIQTRILVLGNYLGINHERIENIEGEHGGFGVNHAKNISIGDLDNVPELKELFPTGSSGKFKNLSKSEKAAIKERATLLMSAEAKSLNGLYARVTNVANAYKAAKTDEERANIQEKSDMLNLKCVNLQTRIKAIKNIIEELG